MTTTTTTPATTTAVLYHSGYGHTERVAQFIAKGAQSSSHVEIIAIDADGNLTESQWAILDKANAIIMGSPTYMGMTSWQFKKFADASSKRWFAGTWAGKVAGGFTCSANLSGDKLSTLQYLITLTMQHGMIWVGQNEKNSNAFNRLGANLGVMAQVGPTSPAADLPQNDLDTAIAYGARIAQIAAKLA